MKVKSESVAQLCPTLCDPMDYSLPGFPVHHQLPEFTQTHVHWVSDAIWGIIQKHSELWGQILEGIKCLKNAFYTESNGEVSRGLLNQKMNYQKETELWSGCWVQGQEEEAEALGLIRRWQKFRENTQGLCEGRKWRDRGKDCYGTFA